MVSTRNHRVSHRLAVRHRCRVAEYEARRALRERGHSVVIRSTDPSFPASLIAWSGSGGVHVFCVVTTRKEIASASEAASLFCREIDELRAIPRSSGMSVNLWVRAGRKDWHRYRVFPGGIAEEVPDVA